MDAVRNLARVVFVVLTILLSAHAAPAAQADALVALDYAFRFASAIETDPKDRGAAQEKVALDYAAAGAFQQAVAAATKIDDWRRGTAFADIATLLARAGRKTEAAALVDKASSFGKTITGWPARRVDSHVAQALTALGRADEAEKLAGSLAVADPQQYSGSSVATVAAGNAAQGDYAGASARLDRLEKDPDMEAAWWRTAGYVALARQEIHPHAERVGALRKARLAVDGISGWKKAEALRSVAECAGLLGERKVAAEALDSAEKIVLSLADTTPMKAPLISNLARSLGTAGETAQAAALLEKAILAAPRSLEIDRPAIYANIASSFSALGEAQRARELFDRSLTEAASLQNSRPRALAVVEVCRFLSRSQIEPDAALRSRLDGLLGGLGDPW